MSKIETICLKFRNIIAEYEEMMISENEALEKINDLLN